MSQGSIKYKYYHNRILKTLQFLITSNKRILFISCQDGHKLVQLAPRKGIGIDLKKSEFRKKYQKLSNVRLIESDYESFKTRQKFDYVVLYATLGKTQNIMQLLNNLQTACHPSTRLIVYQHNYLWQGFLKILEKVRLKRIEHIYNWLSLSDVSSYLLGSGFEVTRVFRRTLCPVYLFGIGPLINLVFSVLPFLDFLKLDQFIIARPKIDLLGTQKPQPSLTICVTVRDEKDNIKPIVTSIPNLVNEQEIMFVEGHSQDGTRQEIRRLIKKYPQKNIRLLIQPGIGQGDATRHGFKHAKGDIIIIFEGDNTAEAQELSYFYEALRTGRFEFILGSRLVYPLPEKAMPSINKFGNMMFAKWFSFVLGQNSTDVLCGIKAISKKDFDNLEKKWGFMGIDDPFGDFELLFGAARMGLKIGEIPVHYHPRTYGKTKTKVFTHGFYLLKMALSGYWIFRNN